MSVKALSIKDIAKKANVSITTVSFIINGKAEEKHISAAVIKRVQDIIEADGYKPNQVARSLRTGNSQIIALMVEDISNPFFAGIARLIEEKAYRKGYKIIFSSTENDPAKTKELLELFKSRQVDAYIISPAEGALNDVKQLMSEGKPVVLFDRCLTGLEASFIGVDHFHASYTATQYFTGKGKKQVAMVTVDLDVMQITDRQNGYQQALQDASLVVDEQLVLKIPFNLAREEAVKLLMKFFKAHPQIDGVLFGTNYLAISGLLALKEMGKELDESFGVIAYDDGDIFKLHSPQISAVAQPLEQIADGIVKLIFKQLKATTPIEAEEIIFPAKLIIR